jgi:hypothetical protein
MGDCPRCLARTSGALSVTLSADGEEEGKAEHGLVGQMVDRMTHILA